MGQTRQQRRREIIRRRALRRLRILLFSIIIIVLLFAFLSNRICTGKTEKNDTELLKEHIKTTYFEGDDFSYINIDEYYVYGTHLNIFGSSNIKEGKEIKDFDIFYTDKEGNENNVSINYEINDSKIEFYISEEINNGINLENIVNGTYAFVVKITYSDYFIDYFLLENNTEYDFLEYYTITKNSKNNKIIIGNDSNLFSISVVESSLPEDVYDIVIDPGHGGKDVGAVSGNYYESKEVMEISLKIKEQLEELGLKVLLTRDGSESDLEDTVYNSYDEDGRVDITCSSGAKYCFSIHLNSNEYELNKGGVEIYSPGNADLSLATSLAMNIVNGTNSDYSYMETYKVKSGVYVRNFLESEISSMSNSAISSGYEPYSITTDTPYLFMIRETGGIITGAFADGRNPSYGANKYMNNNKGVETYVLELGYLSVESDLINILNNKNKYASSITKSIKEYLGL